MNFILKRKNIYLLIFIYSIIAILSAIYIEKVLGYLPCKLCIYQRIPFLVAIFICFLGYNYFKSDRIIIDSQDEDVTLSSNRHINIGAGKNMSITNKGYTVLESKNIYIGTK